MSRLPEVESQSGLLQRVFSRRGIVANFLMRRHLDADSPIQPQLELQPALDPGLSRRGFLGKASAYVAVVALGLKGLDAVSNRPAQVAAGPVPDGTAGPEAAATPEAVASASPAARKLKGPSATATRKPDVQPTGDLDYDPLDDPRHIMGYNLRVDPETKTNHVFGGGEFPAAKNAQECLDHFISPKNDRSPVILERFGLKQSDLDEKSILGWGTRDQIAAKLNELSPEDQALYKARYGSNFLLISFFHKGTNILDFMPTQIVDASVEQIKAQGNEQAYNDMVINSKDDTYMLIKVKGVMLLVARDCENIFIPIPVKPKNTPVPSTPTPVTATSPAPTPDVTPTPTAAPGSGSPSGSGPSGSSPNSSGGPSSSTETPTSTPGSGVVATPTTETSPRPTFTPQGTPLPPTPRPTFTPQPTPAAPTPRPTFTPQPPPSATPRAVFTPSSQTSASASAAASSSPRPGFTPSR